MRVDEARCKQPVRRPRHKFSIARPVPHLAVVQEHADTTSRGPNVVPTGLWPFIMLHYASCYSVHTL